MNNLLRKSIDFQPWTRASALLVAVSLVAACTNQDRKPQYTMDSKSCVTVGQWVNPVGTKPVTSREVFDQALQGRVILLGETHTTADHHRWQLHTLAALHQRRSDMVIGFEAFPRKAQPVLDDWIAGVLSEKEFLEKVRWYEVWSYDPNLYMPLFHFARLHKVPMVALNVERSLVSKLRKEKWSEIPVEQREGVSEPAPAPEALKRRLAEVYLDHMSGFAPEKESRPETKEGDSVNIESVMEEPGFNGFVASMLLWDRAMAEALKNASDIKGKPIVVGIVGTGHLQYGDSIPYQLASMGVRDVSVLLPWNVDKNCGGLVSDNASPIASAVFGMSPMEAPAKPEGPKLGVMIEKTEGGVRIGKVLDDSIAKASGIVVGDIITKAAGVEVTISHGLVQIISRQAPGTWLPLTLLREGKQIELIAKFPVRKVHAKKP